MSARRLESRFTGRVQGVGFRYTTHQISKHHSVVGFVQNQSDGSVQVIVEGERGLNEFLDEVKTVMGSKVHHEQRIESTPSGEFESFEIRR